MKTQKIRLQSSLQTCAGATKARSQSYLCTPATIGWKYPRWLTIPITLLHVQLIKGRIHLQNSYPLGEIICLLRTCHLLDRSSILQLRMTKESEHLFQMGSLPSNIRCPPPT